MVWTNFEARASKGLGYLACGPQFGRICIFVRWNGCHVPPPPFAISPPFAIPPQERSLGPESIGNTRRQRRQRKFLQSAKADLHCDTMVQICGAVPPPPQGGNRHFMTVPPRLGGNRPHKRGEIAMGGEVRHLGMACRMVCPSLREQRACWNNTGLLFARLLEWWNVVVPFPGGL